MIPSRWRIDLREWAMMGRFDREQGHLFYCFNLEEVVPKDHQVRHIADVLDLSWGRTELVRHYSPIGRPSIDPVLMIRMLNIVSNPVMHSPLPRSVIFDGSADQQSCPQDLRSHRPDPAYDVLGQVETSRPLQRYTQRV
jgi:hypothetical protein